MATRSHKEMFVGGIVAFARAYRRVYGFVGDGSDTQERTPAWVEAGLLAPRLEGIMAHASQD